MLWKGGRGLICVFMAFYQQHHCPPSESLISSHSTLPTPGVSWRPSCWSSGSASSPSPTSPWSSSSTSVAATSRRTRTAATLARPGQDGRLWTAHWQVLFSTRNQSYWQGRGVNFSLTLLTQDFMKLPPSYHVSELTLRPLKSWRTEGYLYISLFIICISETRAPPPRIHLSRSCKVWSPFRGSRMRW